MSDISRTALFGKLDPTLYQAIESAYVFAKLRGNPYVELAHWVHQLLQLHDCDLHRIVRRFGLDAGALAADAIASVDRLPRGAASVLDLSEQVPEAIKHAWLYGTLLFGSATVRSGHLLVGLLKTPSLRSALKAISRQFERIEIEALSGDFDAIVAGSPEDAERASDGSAGGAARAGGAAPGETAGAMAPAGMGRQEALARFTTDLTERARAGQLDPVTGRDEEIRQVVDILMRRRQNNPVLTGEAGVGKTAVVEGLALRIARGEVPPPLAPVSLRTLDIGLLQAGASMKGEFEHRLRQLIDEVQASPQPIVLFIDEAHTLIGAGGAAGTGDAANLLKPALARGTLRTIGATTWAEYKKYFAKDPALTRRFQVVPVAEPDEARAIAMMRGMAAPLEAHHGVQLLDEALEAAVRLSQRYIPARQLPDKAVSLLDTACARVAVSQQSMAPEVEDSARRIEVLQTELSIIAREEAVGEDVGARKDGATRRLEAEQARLAELQARWKAENALVERIVRLCEALRSPAGAQECEAAAQDRDALKVQLRAAQADLSRLQGERPLVLPSVDEHAVAGVVADWTGIPVGRMVRDEVESVLRLADTLGARVVGQPHALETIARRIQTARAGLDEPGRPVGVFLLAGPSGVGKTETALALAEALYGGEQNAVTLNMSEFQEAHTVSTLKGAPPGYVGYGEGGVLTEAVRRRPYSVVLLDEIEKAHPDVHELFFQVFDKGWMEDGEGRHVDFRNTIILLTSNVGSDLIAAMCQGAGPAPEPDAVARSLRGPLREVFPAALLGRLVTVPYYPLSEPMLGRIVRLQLDRIVQRVQDRHRISMTYGDDVVELIVSRCTEVESGGRMIDAILTHTVLPTVSRECLGRMVEGAPLAAIALAAQAGQLTYRFQ